MIPKAHLTSHSRVSGSKWVITLLWSSESLRPFCTVLLCILATSFQSLLILLDLYHFCHLFAQVCMKCLLDISNFLEEISSLSHCVVFLYFFALIAEEGFLISPCYSLAFCIQLDISFPFSFSFSFSSFLFIRPPQTTILPCCVSFSLGWFWSLPAVQCYETLSIVLQALCVSDLIPWISLSLLLYNHKGFDLGHTWMV